MLSESLKCLLPIHSASEYTADMAQSGVADTELLHKVDLMPSWSLIQLILKKKSQTSQSSPEICFITVSSRDQNPD